MLACVTVVAQNAGADTEAAMKVRSKPSKPDVVIDLDRPADPFTESLRVLRQVWADMVWLNTTNVELNARRREIAAWVRGVNDELAGAFGQGVATEEIRVILAELPGVVPRHPDEEARGTLTRLAWEARDLATKGRAAVEAATRLPTQRSR
jgi:hypothetical protein